MMEEKMNRSYEETVGSFILVLAHDEGYFSTVFLAPLDGSGS